MIQRLRKRFIRIAMLSVALVLLALGSWMFKVMDEFVVELFAIMASL